MELFATERPVFKKVTDKFITECHIVVCFLVKIIKALNPHIPSLNSRVGAAGSFFFLLHEFCVEANVIWKKEKKNLLLAWVVQMLGSQ